MAQIKFYSADGLHEPFDIDIAGSGLGFYGAGGFGKSVPVGEYQENTFVTDGNGIVQGPQGNNVKWIHANSGEVPTDNQLNLLDIPNALATLKIEFTHESEVEVQNAELRIYDRSDITVGASGVTTKVAEIIHPSETQTGQLGSGDASWIEPAGSSVVVELAQSPGVSGLYAADGESSTRADTIHSWYCAVASSPDSIGSKTQYGLYVSLEYL